MVPSAISITDTPSPAFRVAWLMPSNWEFIRFAIARPAGLSLAKLILKPEDNLVMEVCNLLSFLFKELRAIAADTL
ncbi:hypothetical protein IMSAGC019_00417 [Lachnospiraceae bacterium]|nr:hypothetical protein IMSAGC019_00417 [Lachnospiraceae bacterium]